MSSMILNPNIEIVNYIKKQIRENNGYCIHADEHNKSTKCPKACKKSGNCTCGMYVQETHEPDEFDLD